MTKFVVKLPKLFDSLYRYSSDGMVAFDDNNTIVFVNDKAVKVFQKTEKELVGTRLRTLFAGREASIDDDGCRVAFGSYILFFRAGQDNESVWYKALSHKIDIDGGQSVWLLAFSCTQNLRLVNKAESSLNKIFSGSRIGFGVKDIDDNGRYIHCNNAFARNANCKTSDIIGRRDSEVLAFSGIEQPQKAGSAAGEYSCPGFHDEAFTDGNGLNFRLRIASFPFLNADGHKCVCMVSERFAETEDSAKFSTALCECRSIMRKEDIKTAIPRIMEVICTNLAASYVSITRCCNDERDWELVYTAETGKINSYENEAGMKGLSNKTLFMQTISKNGVLELYGINDEKGHIRSGVNFNVAQTANLQNSRFVELKVDGKPFGFISVSYRSFFHELSCAEKNFLSTGAQFLEEALNNRDSLAALKETSLKLQENQKLLKLFWKTSEFIETAGDMSPFMLNARTFEVYGSENLSKFLPVEDGHLQLGSGILDNETASMISQELSALISGAKDRIDITYPCDSFIKGSWYRLIARLDKDEHACIIGLIHNITEIRGEHLRQQKLEQMHNLVMDSIPVFYFVKNADRNFIYSDCNKNFAKRIGMEKEEIIGKTDADFFSSEELIAAFRRDDENVLACGHACSFTHQGEDENRVAHGESPAHTYSIIKVPFTNEYDERCIFGLELDVTELYAERSSKERIQKLWNLLLENVHLGVYIQDIDDGFRFLQVNKAFAEMLGLAKEKFIGHLPEETSTAITGDICRRNFSALTESGGTHMEFDDKIAVMGLHKTFHVANTLYKNSENGHRLILGTVADITERMRLVNLEKLNAALMRENLIENDLDSALHTSARIVCEYLNCCSMSWFGKNETGIFHTRTSIPEELQNIIRTDDGELHEIIINNLSEDPMTAAFAAANPDYPKALISLAVNSSRGPLGMIVLQFADEQHFTQNSIKQFSTAINTFSIIMLRLYDSVRLANSEKLLHRVVDTIPMPLLVKDASDPSAMRYRMCNEAFCKLACRKDPASIIGKSDKELFGDEISEQIENENRELLTSEVPEKYETSFQIYLPNGTTEIRYLQKHKRSFEDTEGKKMLLCVVSDITQDKRRKELDDFRNDIVAYLNANNSFDDRCSFVAEKIMKLTDCRRVTLVSPNTKIRRSADTDRFVKEWTAPGVPITCFSCKKCQMFNQASLIRTAEHAIDLYDLAKYAGVSNPRTSCGVTKLISAKITVDSQFWGAVTVHFDNNAVLSQNEDKFFREILEMAASMYSIILEHFKEEEETRKKEHEKQLLIENTVIPVAMFDGNGQRLLCNEQYEKFIVREDRATLFHEPAQQSIVRGDSKHISQKWNNNGQVWRIDAHGIFDRHTGKLQYIFKFAINVTDLERNLYKQETLRDCAELILKQDSKDFAGYTKELVRNVINYFQALGGNMLQFNDSGITPLGIYGTYNVDIPQMESKSFMSQKDAAAWKAKTASQELIRVKTTDTHTIDELNIGAWAELMRSNNIGVFYSIRLMQRDKVWGNLTLSFQDPNHELSVNDLSALHNFQHTIEMLILKNDLIASLKYERDQAIEAEKAKSFFFSCISHDIRTPLNSIIGYSDLLKMGEVSEQQQEEYLNNITFSGNTLMHLIDDVLDFAKLDANKLELQPSMCDFESLADNLVKVAAKSADNSNIEFILDKPEEIPHLNIDSHRISQILLNITNNAVKFTERGSITLHTDFQETAADSGTLTFWVEDTGVGIAKEDIANLLKPFVRVKNRTQMGGTGLGLSICNMLVKKMGGEILIDSEPDKGSRFTIRIPNVKFEKKAGEKAQNQPQQTLNTDEAPGAAVSLLLVDDSPINLKVLSAICRKLQCKNIELASSGIEALQKLETGSFDAILSDVWMPKMDGKELAKAVRADRRWDNTLIYALTADVEITKTDEDNKFDGVILKPVHLQNLGVLLSEIASIKKKSSKA